MHRLAAILLDYECLLKLNGGRSSLFQENWDQEKIIDTYLITHRGCVRIVSRNIGVSKKINDVCKPLPIACFLLKVKQEK